MKKMRIYQNITANTKFWDRDSLIISHRKKDRKCMKDMRKLSEYYKYNDKCIFISLLSFMAIVLIIIA